MAAKDVIVWLLEWPEDDSNHARWWREAPNTEGGGGWKRDAYKATWFHREQDAKDFQASRLLHGKVTQHTFLD